MPYPALPDHKMPYDIDGTVVGYGALGASDAFAFASGVTTWLDGATKIELNDDDYTALPTATLSVTNGSARPVWLFFPESRECTAIYYGTPYFSDAVGLDEANTGLSMIQGSNDSTNGVDGTWETASLPGGRGQSMASLDGFRAVIKPISFTGPKKVIRLTGRNFSGRSSANHNIVALHVFGEKAAGQTPDDLVFIDHDTTPGAEYEAPEDFGDRPLGTSVVRQFRVKNVSATRTANAINLQCNDTDFAISTDGTTWVVTINIASLAAGAESATLYIRNTTPAAGALVGPRFSRIVALVGSWT